MVRAPLFLQVLNWNKTDCFSLSYLTIKGRLPLGKSTSIHHEVEERIVAVKLGDLPLASQGCLASSWRIIFSVAVGLLLCHVYILAMTFRLRNFLLRQIQILDFYTLKDSKESEHHQCPNRWGCLSSLRCGFCWEHSSSLWNAKPYRCLMGQKYSDVPYSCITRI